MLKVSRSAEHSCYNRTGLRRIVFHESLSRAALHSLAQFIRGCFSEVSGEPRHPKLSSTSNEARPHGLSLPCTCGVSWRHPPPPPPSVQEKLQADLSSFADEYHDRVLKGLALPAEPYDQEEEDEEEDGGEGVTTGAGEQQEATILADGTIDVTPAEQPPPVYCSVVLFCCTWDLLGAMLAILVAVRSVGHHVLLLFWPLIAACVTFGGVV